MIDKINIRTLNLDDLDQIVEVENGAWNEELRFSRETMEGQLKEAPDSFIGYFEASGGSASLKGFVYFRRIEKYQHIKTWKQATQQPLKLDGKIAYIVNVSVHPQGRGHGTRLMNGVARILQSRGIELSVLGSREGTESFYRRCGYEVFARYSEWWPEDAESAGKGILMKKELKKVWV